MRALASIAAAASLALCTQAQADAMRCGSHLVGDGDTRSAVRELCGEPSDVQTRTILRRPFFDFHGNIVSFGDALVEVPVEVWTYNFGPYKLMRRVRFVDGLIDEIETLGYGYHERESTEAPPRDDAYRDTYR